MRMIVTEQVSWWACRFWLRQEAGPDLRSSVASHALMTWHNNYNTSNNNYVVSVNLNYTI